ncbi:MAG: hypothetical protein ACJ72L_03645 [Marmoricola sp.]
MNPRRHRTLAALAGGALLLAPLAGCGSDSSSKGDAPTSRTAASAGIDKTVFVSDLLGKIDPEKYVHLTVEAGTLFSASGDVDFTSTPPRIALDVAFGGSKRSIVLADGALYLQKSPGGDYRKVDPKDPTLGGISSMLSGFAPRDAVAGLKDGITKITSVGSGSVDGVAVTEYKVTVKPEKTTGAFKALAGSGGGPSTLDLVLYVDRDKLLRRIETEFSGQKIALTMSDWGKPVAISVPKTA